MTAAANLFFSQVGKPPLDQVQPGRTGRSEMQVELRSFDQPFLNHGGLVRPVIIENYMDIQTVRDIVLYKVKEFVEFNATVSPLAFAEHFAGSCIESSKKRVFRQTRTRIVEK